jgi:hypothetical protein
MQHDQGILLEDFDNLIILSKSDDDFELVMKTFKK